MAVCSVVHGRRAQPCLKGAVPGEAAHARAGRLAVHGPTGSLVDLRRSGSSSLAPSELLRLGRRCTSHRPIYCCTDCNSGEAARTLTLVRRHLLSSPWIKRQRPWSVQRFALAVPWWLSAPTTSASPGNKTSIATGGERAQPAVHRVEARTVRPLAGRSHLVLADVVALPGPFDRARQERSDRRVAGPPRSHIRGLSGDRAHCASVTQACSDLMSASTDAMDVGCARRTARLNETRLLPRCHRGLP